VTPFTTLSVLAHAEDRAALEQQWLEDFGGDLITPIPWEDFARSSQDARLARKHWHLPTRPRSGASSCSTPSTTSTCAIA
jgi:hypothetical protein